MRPLRGARLLALLAAPVSGLGAGRSRVGRSFGHEANLDDYLSDLGRFTADLQQAPDPQPPYQDALAARGSAAAIAPEGGTDAVSRDLQSLLQRPAEAASWPSPPRRRGAAPRAGPAGEAPFAAAEVQPQGVQFPSEWATADALPADSFAPRAAGFAPREDARFGRPARQADPNAAGMEALDMAALQRSLQEPPLAAGPATVDTGVLGRDLSRLQRLAVSRAPQELEPAESRQHFAPTELEAEVATASRAASALAHDAAVLSQELGKLNGLLRGAPATGAEAVRPERETLGLLELANATSAANATRGAPALLAAGRFGLARSILAGNSTNGQNYTGFKKYFTLGNKISIGWSVVYWVALVLIFIFLVSFCCVWRMRQTA